MASITETWHKVPSFWKKLTATVGTLASVAAIYTTLNIVFDVTLRPAWVWELQEITVGQLETRLSLEQINRRELHRDLAQFLAMREEFNKSEEPVPDWLTDQIAQGEEDIRRIAEEIDRIQEELVRLAD